MPEIKPSVTQTQVLTLLQEKFSTPITEITPITEGQVARTFSFLANGKSYIIRFTRHMGVNLEKEAYVYEHFSSPNVPIPPVIEIGRLGELHYAISQRMPGRSVNTLPLQEIARLLPALVEVLDAIHHADVQHTHGSGIFDERGVGLFPSWRQSLRQIREEEEEWDLFGKWHTLFEETFLERDLFERIYDRMVQLLDYVPEERFLVHSGYGFGNVLVDNGKITAILDWLDAKYGDFVYDVAWVDLWGLEAQFAKHYQRYRATKGEGIPNYKERLLCYQCAISLDALRFYAKIDNESSYLWIRERILSLLACL